MSCILSTVLFIDVISYIFDSSDNLLMPLLCLTCLTQLMIFFPHSSGPESADSSRIFTAIRQGEACDKVYVFVEIHCERIQIKLSGIYILRYP